MYFAVMICRFGDKMSTIRYGVVPFVGVLLVVCGLLFLEPHVSAIMIIVAIGLVMIFVGGGKLWWFIGGGASVAALLGVAYLTLSHVRERFASWLDPFADIADSGWQVVQSLYAIGSGGVLGLGLGNSRQKYLYRPEEHNDYIFSVVCEELGYIGAVLILALFALLIIRGYWVAMRSRDRYSFLVGVGITTLFALQVILNVAVCTNTIPSTGISLPLFSYGGTALLIQMAELGILLSISRDISEKK
jgi:cell division protein FtsW